MAEVTVKVKLWKVCKHVIVMCFKVMDQNFVEGTEENP
jgi:hypothetical protein